MDLQNFCLKKCNKNATRKKRSESPAIPKQKPPFWRGLFGSDGALFRAGKSDYSLLGSM